MKMKRAVALLLAVTLIFANSAPAILAQEDDSTSNSEAGVVSTVNCAEEEHSTVSCKEEGHSDSSALNLQITDASAAEDDVTSQTLQGAALASSNYTLYLENGDITVTVTVDGQTVRQGSTIYTDGSFTFTMDSGTTETSNTITVITDPGTTAEFTIENVNISSESSSPIEIGDSSAVITLSGNNTIACIDNAAIHVSCGSVTIKENETASLTATSGNESKGVAAAIGSNGDETMSGSITIESGTVTATGRFWGAGIGTGDESELSGSISITGGTVTATGDFWGAGIGTGDGGELSGSISITDGTVTATGSGSGAGIGTGCGGELSGSISITGGTVAATGSGSGAGIGTGDGGGLSGSISITGGTVTATGDFWGAGIGTGDSGELSGSISITGGTVTATGDFWGAGIGTGDSGELSGSISITGGTVAATGTGDGAGIGTGDGGGLSGSISITGGTVTATGTGDGAGIGANSIVSENASVFLGCHVIINGKSISEYMQEELQELTLDAFDVLIIAAYSYSVDGFCTVCGAYEPAEQNGEGVYEISNAGQLFWFASLVNGDTTQEGITAAVSDARAVLTGNIDLSVKTTTHTDTEWTPIGTGSVPYTGTFDGCGYKISGLDITTAADYVGLFGYVTGTVRNLTVSGDINVSGNTMYVGGIVGTVKNGTLQGLTSYVNVTVYDSKKGVAGGVVAAAEGDDGTAGSAVERCAYFGTVKASGVLDCIGGIVGYMNAATINHCMNHGTVDTTGGTAASSAGIYTGGIVSYCNNANAVVTNCYNYGTIAGAGSNTGDICYTGAVIGRINKYVKEVSNCYYLESSLDGVAANGSSVTADVSEKTADEFASGEVAYLLNGSTSAGNIVWYQNLDDGKTADSYPVLDSSHGTVYYGTNCAGTAIYSNSTVPAAEHSWDEGTVTTEATCTGSGVKTYTCTICGETSTETIAATGHSYEAAVTDPTCTEKGYTTYTCTVCGDSYTADETEATGHSLTYVASGNTITEGCVNGCGHSVTATLTAPTSLIYDGTAKAASVSYGDGWLGGVLAVTYKSASNQTVAASAVVNAGTYIAEITAEGVTASVTFYISKADLSVTAPTGLTATYGDTLAGVELPDGWSWDSSAQSVGSAGENTFTATYTPDDEDNYNAVQADLTVTVAPLPVAIVWDATGFEYDGTQKTVTPSVSNALTGDTINLTVSGNEAVNAGSYTATVTGIDNANYTLTGGTGLTNSWNIVDITAPTGVITVAENSFRSFINFITFGIFCNDKYDVTITADDAGTAVASIEYLLSETAISQTDIVSATGWKTYSGTFAIEDEGAYIIYARITDEAGNTTYISSDGLVIDQTIPAVSGIEDGGTYCAAVTITVFDDYLDKVTVNGVEQALTNNSFTVNPADGEQTITVTDKAGNSAVYKVTVNDGHTWSEGAVTKEATCTEEGVMTYTCTVCGETKTETIPATGHTAGEAVIENEAEATCTKDGSYDTVVYCTVCGEELSRETTVVPAKGHTAGEEAIENKVEATCTKEGSYDTVVYCTVCGEELSRETTVVSATGHTAGEEAIENKVEATCTKDGSYDTVVYCMVCGAEISRETTVVSATGHTAGEAVIENKVEATCIKDGSYDTVVYCTVCGAEISRETIVVPATDHTAGEAVIENEVEATCTEDGSYDTVVYCTVCGAEISRETTVVPATGHTAGEAVIENEVEATCTEDGSYDTVVYCTECGAEISRETTVVPATGHTSGEAVIENKVEATCTEAGSYDTVVYCTECGAEISRETTVVPATNHTSGKAVTENKVEATCTEEGSYDTVVYCTECGAEISRETTVVPATGHSFGEWEEVISPTCEDHGSERHTCTVCGYVETRYVDATGHDWEDGFTVDQEPTCTTDGSRSIHCKNCDAVKDSEAIPATGHAAGEAVIENEVQATCTENGSYDTVVYCKVCGDEMSRVTTTVPALGHTAGEAVIENKVEATCTEAGSYDTVVYCTVCGEEVSRVTTAVPATGHDFGEVTYTWSSDGLTCTATRICKTDTSHAEQVTAAVTGVETKAATCTEKGETTYTAVFAEAWAKTQTKTIADIPALGHDFSGSFDAWDENGHWHICNRDGCTATDEPEAHSFTNYVYDEGTATWTSEGTETAICDADGCGHTHTRTADGSTLPDDTAPTGEITVGLNRFKDFINTITFGIFCKDKYDVTITAEDGETGIASIEYLLSETEISEADITSADGWQIYEGKFAIEDEGKYIIYAKITDNAGNIVYISTDGLVVDRTNPEVSGIEDGGIYCGAVEAGVYDEYLATVTVDGVEQTLTDGKFTVYPAEKEQTITVTDRAGNSVSYTITVRAEHTWDSGEVTKAVTCTETGEMTYTCTICGETKTETIPATGHTAGEAVIENEVEATCTEEGSYDTVVYCTVCGEELSRETTTIPALSHTAGEAVIENEVEATCTEEGSYDTVVYCTVCGEEVSRETVTIPATGHTAGEAVIENEVEATCTEEGSYDIVVYCTVCGEELSRETTTIPVLGHTAGEAVIENEVEATCTEEGLYDIVVYCTVCGEELNRETTTIPAKGHTAGEAVIENEVEETCTEEGSYDTVVYCTVCGAEISRETVTVPALGHTAGEAVIENEVEATCTEEGSYDIVVYCTVCGEELSRETVTVSAVGHSYGEPVWNWNSDHTEAWAVFICGHDASHTETVTATITITENELEILYTATVILDGQTWTDERTVAQEETTPEETTVPEETTTPEETTAEDETTTAEETTATPTNAEEETTASGGSSSVTGDISVGIWIMILFVSGTFIVCILQFGKKREKA